MFPACIMLNSDNYDTIMMLLLWHDLCFKKLLESRKTLIISLGVGNVPRAKDDGNKVILCGLLTTLHKNILKGGDYHVTTQQHPIGG